MFSLQKNFIKEQQQLVNDIQDELIEAKIKNAKLEELMTTHEAFIVYFKKVAQILSHYSPEHSEMGNIILDIVDHCNLDDCGDEYMNNLESRINTWEQSLIEDKEKKEAQKKLDEEKQIEEQKRLEEQKKIEEQKLKEEKEKKQAAENNADKKPANSEPPKVVESFGGIVLVDEE